MRILCNDIDSRDLYVFEASDVYYDSEMNALVLTPINPKYEDYVIKNIGHYRANNIITTLLEKGYVNLSSEESIALYPDEEDEDDESSEEV